MASPGTSSSSGKRKASRDYSGCIWPKRRASNSANVIMGKTKEDWATVEALQIGGRQFIYRQQEKCSANVLLVFNRFTVTWNNQQVSLPRKTEDTYSCRAKFLADQIYMLPEKKHKIRQEKQQRRRPAISDSDDEGQSDPETELLFTSGEMSVLQHFFEMLQFSYDAVCNIGCYNAPGKTFVCDFANYMLSCRGDMRFRALPSTSTGPTQPGALYVMWETSPKKLRRSSDVPILSEAERYADCVVYDRHTQQNVIVVEVKSDPESAARSQNNEQMVGLWGDEQVVMLGMEMRGHTVFPKVLLKIEGESESVMQMMYLESMDLLSPDGLLKLAKVMVAFMTFIDYGGDGGGGDGSGGNGDGDGGGGVSSSN